MGSNNLPARPTDKLTWRLLGKRSMNLTPTGDLKVCVVEDFRKKKH